MRWQVGIVTAIALAGAACSSSSTSNARYTENDPEYQLAALAGAGLDDGSVAIYDRALDDAEAVCTDTRSRISDFAYGGQQIALDEGVIVTSLELLEAIPEAVPAELGEVACGDIVASIIALMAAEG